MSPGGTCVQDYNKMASKHHQIQNDFITRDLPSSSTNAAKNLRDWSLLMLIVNEWRKNWNK